jgi:hypothetical protein
MHDFVTRINLSILRTQPKSPQGIPKLPKAVEIAPVRSRCHFAPVPVPQLLAQVAGPDTRCGRRAARVVDLVACGKVVTVEAAHEGAAFEGVLCPFGVAGEVFVEEARHDFGGGGGLEGVLIARPVLGGCDEESEGECPKPELHDHGVLFPVWRGCVERKNEEWGGVEVARPEGRSEIMNMRKHSTPTIRQVSFVGNGIVRVFIV